MQQVYDTNQMRLSVLLHYFHKLIVHVLWKAGESIISFLIYKFVVESCYSVLPSGLRGATSVDGEGSNLFFYEI